MTIDLYHFTSLERLPILLEQGISKGDVPTSPIHGFNAPWLTADQSWGDQKWSECSYYNKRAVRLKVSVPKSDRQLWKWSEVAKKYKIAKWWYDALNEGNTSSEWYIYKGVIPAAWIVTIDKNPSQEKVSSSIELGECNSYIPFSGFEVIGT